MPKARLEITVERLRKAEGSGKNGRDWLVKELARVVQETHVLQAEVLKRDELVLEIHGQVIVIFVLLFQACLYNGLACLSLDHSGRAEEFRIHVERCTNRRPE